MPFGTQILSVNDIIEGILSNWGKTRPKNGLGPLNESLIVDLKNHLKRGQYTDAFNCFEELHRRSQSSIVYHTKSHIYCAKIYRKQSRWKGSLTQMYLGLMAPYGTVRRRMAGRMDGEENPQSLISYFLSQIDA